ncbi:hypothetical protein DH2020_036345 [Rehmannia glutinosa]|uniref:Uncharacterized protein n=1 Tax=Rehmannia glutinosa TaxID=99300 RepID=A0ABR0V4W5_REHGL
MGSYVQIRYCFMFVGSSFLNKDYNFQSRKTILIPKKQFQFKYLGETENGKRIFKGNVLCNGFLFPVDSWALNLDSPLLASQLSAFSLLPYMGFLYFITKSNSAPRLTLFGFYFLLAFVGAATKVHYVTSLSNVDWLHGGAESLLMLTNLFIVLGLREALRKLKMNQEKH